MLVWRGKIKKTLDTPCPSGDFICEFSCDEIAPFRLKVCGRLFVEKNGNDVAIPMEFKMGDKVYNPAVENTPLSHVEK